MPLGNNGWRLSITDVDAPGPLRGHLALLGGFARLVPHVNGRALSVWSDANYDLDLPCEVDLLPASGNDN